MATSNQRFEDLLKDFHKKIRSGKNLIRDEISEEGVTIIDLMAALHAEHTANMNRLTEAVAGRGFGEALISTFPAREGILAVPSGQTVFDLRSGKVTISGLGEKEHSMSVGLDTLKMERFRSAFFYVDQPCILKVDDQANYPLEMGRNQLVFDMREKIIVESYMPMSIAMIFSTSPVPPVQPLGGVAFWRHGVEDETANSFAELLLRPKSINYHRNNAQPGVADRKILPVALLTRDDEGIPVVSKLLRKTIIVENEDDTNSANIQIRVNSSEGETLAPHPVTGEDGVEVAAGDFAVFHFDELFWRMNVRTKSTTAGSHAGDIECGMLGEFS